jgi:hypothetical protein
MGNLNVVPFIRNDNIDGQGKSLLLAAKKTHIKNSELDRLYEVFKKITGPTVEYCDVHELLLGYGNATFFESVLGHRFESHGIFKSYLFEQYCSNGVMTFERFVISLWALLSTTNDLLAAYCFNMFDAHRLVAFLRRSVAECKLRLGCVSGQILCTIRRLH